MLREYAISLCVRKCRRRSIILSIHRFVNSVICFLSNYFPYFSTYLASVTGRHTRGTPIFVAWPNEGGNFVGSVSSRSVWRLFRFRETARNLRGLLDRRGRREGDDRRAPSRRILSYRYYCRRTAKRTVVAAGNANLICASPRAPRYTYTTHEGKLSYPARYIILTYGALNTILPIVASFIGPPAWCERAREPDRNRRRDGFT